MANETVKKASLFDIPQIWDLTIEQKYLVQDLIPEGTVVMLTGESGSGKSSVALKLAHCIARGVPFLGHEVEKRYAVIIDKENGLAVYHQRIERFGIERNDHMIFWGPWNDPSPQGPDFKLITEFAAEYKPLIIFDSFVAFHPGSEQDATETRKYMEGYRKLAGLGATVVCIHHTGKSDSTKDYRGSSDIKASIDVGYVLTAKKPLLKLLNLKPFKSREGVIESMQITFEGTEFYVAEDTDYALVYDFIKRNPNINQSDIIEKLPDLSIARIRRVLGLGERKGEFLVNKGPKNASFYTLSK